MFEDDTIFAVELGYIRIPSLWIFGEFEKDLGLSKHAVPWLCKYINIYIHMFPIWLCIFSTVCIDATCSSKTAFPKMPSLYIFFICIRIYVYSIYSYIHIVSVKVRLMRACQLHGSEHPHHPGLVAPHPHQKRGRYLVPCGVRSLALRTWPLHDIDACRTCIASLMLRNTWSWLVSPRHSLARQRERDLWLTVLIFLPQKHRREIAGSLCAQSWCQAAQFHPNCNHQRRHTITIVLSSSVGLNTADASCRRLAHSGPCSLWSRRLRRDVPSHPGLPWCPDQQGGPWFQLQNLVCEIQRAGGVHDAPCSHSPKLSATSIETADFRRSSSANSPPVP